MSQDVPVSPGRSPAGSYLFLALVASAGLLHWVASRGPAPPAGRAATPARPAIQGAPMVQGEAMVPPGTPVQGEAMVPPGAPVQGEAMVPSADPVQGEPMVAPEPAAETALDGSEGDAEPDPERLPGDDDPEEGDWTTRKAVQRVRRRRTKPRPVEVHDTNVAPKSMEVSEGKDEYLLGKYLKLTFDRLGDFDYEPPLPGEESDPDQIPEEIRALSGKPVAIEGYMTPLDFEGGGSTRFILMAQSPSCCFGGSMGMNEWLLGETKDKQRFKPSSYLPVVAVGTLEVSENFNEYGEIISLFGMQVDDVRTVLEGGKTTSRMLPK